MASKILVPEMGESVVDARVARWLKQQGQTVAAGEALVELETEKVNVEVAAERAGVLTEILRQAGEDVKVGEILGTIEETSETPAATAERFPPPQEEVMGPAAGTPRESEAVASAALPPPRTAVAEAAAPPPAALAGAPGEPDAQQPAEGTPALASAAPGPTPQRQEERVRLSRRRLTIARRLVEVQQTAAMLTTFNEIDMGAVMDLRTRMKERFRQRHGVPLGITAFFVKAVIGVLKNFPRLNGELQGEEIVLKHYYDIGIAVDADEGLVVPVLRDADRMPFVEIERGIREYAWKATERTLSLEELRGGTFTITNGGVFGSLLSTPILNPPQVGILGLHQIEERPVVRSGAVVSRPMMYVALTYDHRIVDGRESVQFLVQVRELIEDPGRLLLEF